MPNTNSPEHAPAASAAGETFWTDPCPLEDRTVKLRWRKLAHGTWVDSHAHYCIRARRHTDESSYRRMRTTVFDVWAMYPDIRVERIDAAGTLTAAKQAAACDWDAFGAELSAFGPAPNEVEERNPCPRRTP